MKTYLVIPRRNSLLIICISLFLCLPRMAISQSKASLRKVNVNRGDTLVVAGVLTSRKVNSPDKEAYYYWYGSNKIHKNQGAYTGNLIHGEYLKLYPQGRMIAKGNFSYGLKNGQWLQWYPDGSLYRTVGWKKGHLHGDFITYNPSGEIDFHGRYRMGKPRGTFFFFEDEVPHKAFYLGGREFFRRSMIREVTENED